MFKNEEQVATFTDLIEKFVLGIIRKEASPRIEDAVILNKHREQLETFIMAVCNITVHTNLIDITLLCPECGGEMALRTNRSNGQKFWGCKKYPNCKGTRNEDGLSRAELEEQKYKKEQSVQEGGFSFNRDKRRPATEVSPTVTNVSSGSGTGWVNPFAK